MIFLQFLAREKIGGFPIYGSRNLRDIQKRFEGNSNDIERNFATDLCTPNSKTQDTKTAQEQGHSLQTNLYECNNLSVSSPRFD